MFENLRNEAPLMPPFSGRMRTAGDGLIYDTVYGGATLAPFASLSSRTKTRLYNDNAQTEKTDIIFKFYQM